jgi:hypothetical protein
MKIHSDIASHFQLWGESQGILQREIQSPEVGVAEDKVQARIHSPSLAKERMERVTSQILNQPNLAVMLHSNLNASRAPALIGQP